LRHQQIDELFWTMAIKRSVFGTFGGKPVEAFTLVNRNGIKAKVMSHGARLIEMQVPDRDGRLADVVLGFDDLDSYATSTLAMGGTCGRVVNRIRHGRFMLDGKGYELTKNWRGHQLHGGAKGFEQRLWTAEPNAAQNEVAFRYVSSDGEEGYPGTVTARCVYRLGEDDSLTITLQSETDRPTITNLAHHSYWNLAGHDEGTIEDHFIAVEADRYTPMDKDLMPKGTVEEVKGTAFDLTSARRLGDCFVELMQSGQTEGFDCNWCLNGADGQVQPVAIVTHEASGRKMTLSTSEPGLQIYTAGTFPDQLKGKKGAVYGKFSGIALEPQIYPDAVNIADFPSVRLDPGERRVQIMRVDFASY
jgi:aldose 1-epimerase